MEYEIKPVSKTSLGLKELWEFRELFYFFTWRDIKVKYKQTVLGVLWAILQPLLLMIVFTLFFGQALGVPTENNTPYPIFVYSGLLLWNIFSSGLSNASNSMVSNAGIIKKIYFPRLIIPISAILVALFDFIMALIIYIGILIYYHQPVDSSILLFFPLSLLITVFTTFGLGTMLAAMNVKYRDFRYVIPFFIQILFFVTPVIYPVSIIKFPWAQKILMLNPLAGAIELLRSPVAHSVLNIQLVVISLIISFVLFFFGLFYFRKTEYYFADLA
ncbi:MAG: ABC transporter permease [Bacteroidetes bacterium]|nr:ABC transporter permease [Bacteroidota bacterium]